MLLATDLDGTFLGGSLEHKKRLYKLFQNDLITLVFVTGRGIESILPLFEDEIMPRPSYIISDVGATVVYGDTLKPVEPLQSGIKKKWPGSAGVLQHFKDAEWLQYQPVAQQRRCSFFLKDASRVQQAKQMADEINCDVIYSAGKFLDVLPKGVNKGSTLTNLLEYLKVNKNNVLIAGDTMNDFSLYECGFNSVAVGASEPALLKATSSMKHVFHAQIPGAGGIIEAMEHFKVFKSFINAALHVA